jgi:ribonucleoside-diphosphate reductase alpha chain
MDISITFGEFPTEKIRDTTKAYRQLGIGYANLGALLMATGHAYDSADGRAIAAAITSLMTASAYKTSAELAAVVGPYDGYAKNATAHQRVMACTPTRAPAPPRWRTSTSPSWTWRTRPGRSA